MASGFFAILDDIGVLMDDVVAASKIATRKTAGILGDDLAVNAEKATGFISSRELPVLWAITRGSLVNKLIIIPAAFLLNFFFPASIVLILILGGFYLAYEGVEKIVDYFFAPAIKQDKILKPRAADAEKSKIQSAIVTDFILSAEIVILSLGTVLDKALVIQLLTVCIVALLATAGVYGLVALIVRMDDAGHALLKRSNNAGFLARLGQVLVNLLPLVIKFLSVVGTIALLLVSGGIFNHNINYVHDVFPGWPLILKEFMLGLLAGLVVVLIVKVCKKLFYLIQSKLSKAGN